MNKKLVYFAILLTVLMIGDFLTTNYLIQNSIGYEGNPFMAEVVNSPITFLLVKLISAGLIISMIGWSLKRNEKIAGYGMKTILFLMIIVVSNNLLVINASATYYGFTNPYSMTQPGQVWDGVPTTEFFISNGSFIVGMACMTNGTTFDFSGCGTSKRLINGGSALIFGVTDWTSNGGFFFVDSAKNVGHVTANQVDYSAGWYNPGSWDLGCAVDGNCNPMYKIGTLTSLNTKMSGFVDSNGDFYVADGVKIVRFVQSNEYSQTTVKTLASGTDYTAAHLDYCGSGCTAYDMISGLALDSAGNTHVLVGGYASGCCLGANGGAGPHSYVTHTVFNNIWSKIYSTGITEYSISGSYGTFTTDLTKSGFLLANEGNLTTNITVAFAKGSTVYLVHAVGGSLTDICSGSCSTITGLNGIGQVGTYVYLASAAENKVYKFPTTFPSYVGYTWQGTGGGGGGSTPAELTYTTSTILSKYDTYFNNSEFEIFYDLSYNATHAQSDYIRHRIDLFNPQGTPIASYQPLDMCEQPGALDNLLDFDWETTVLYPCGSYFDTPGFTINTNFKFTTDSAWQNGTYRVSLLEINEGTGSTSTLDTDTFTVLAQLSPYVGARPGTDTGDGGSTDPIQATANFGANLWWFMSLPMFWGLIIWVLSIAAVAQGKTGEDRSRSIELVAIIGAALEAVVGLWAPYTWFVVVILIIVLGATFYGSRKVQTGGS